MRGELATLNNIIPLTGCQFYYFCAGVVVAWERVPLSFCYGRESLTAGGKKIPGLFPGKVEGLY